MALERRGGRHNPYLRHIAAGAGALLNPNVINGAQQIGRYMANQVRNYYDNYEQPDREEQMEPDSTNNEPSNNIQAVTNFGNGSASAGGPRGALIGNTQTNQGYEKHYHERQLCYSKKLKLRMCTWGISMYGPRHPESGNRFPLIKWGTTGAGGLAIPGIVCLTSGNIIGNSTFNAINPYGGTETQIDFSENIYSNALNFRLKDFLDNKLFNDSGTKGLFLNYRKFRLKSFTIQIIPITCHQSILHHAPSVMNNGRNFNGWQSFLDATQKAEFAKVAAARFTDEVDPGYFFYRDQYCTYSDANNNIPLLPPDSLADASESTLKREQYAIKNLDSNLTYVKSGETFSFTREINPTGSYYFDKASLLANMNTNIANIVNILEGQITDGSTIVSKLMEGFNLLFVPGKAKIMKYGETKLNSSGNGYILIPEMMTQLQMKTLATWEVFDYNYSDNAVMARTLDPMEKALFDYNVEKSVELAQLNRS